MSEQNELPVPDMEGPGLPLVASYYTQGRYRRATVAGDRGQALTFLDAAAARRQKALLRQAMVDDLSARIAELQRQLEARDKALALLAGLHPCVTTDDPQALSQQVFDAVMSETSDLRKEAATSRAQAEEYAALASKAMKQANAAERQLEDAHEQIEQFKRSMRDMTAAVLRDSIVQAANNHVASASLKLEDAREDARRYRALRRGQHWSVINGIGDVLRADELDAAIDAAVAAEGGGNADQA